MKKIANFLKTVLLASYVKYTVVLIVGVVLIGFVGTNSLWAHFANERRIGELQEEIDHYEGRYRSDQAQIRQLQSNPKAMERIARERYFMKMADEDIFVLSDDQRQSDTQATAHETAE